MRFRWLITPILLTVAVVGCLSSIHSANSAPDQSIPENQYWVSAKELQNLELNYKADASKSEKLWRYYHTFKDDQKSAALVRQEAAKKGHAWALKTVSDPYDF